MTPKKKDIRNKITELLLDLTDNDYQDIFETCRSDEEKLRLLPSESMLALLFITSVEDDLI